MIIPRNWSADANPRVFYSHPFEGVLHTPNTADPNNYANSAGCYYRFIMPDNYPDNRKITIHIVWGMAGPVADVSVRYIVDVSKSGEAEGRVPIPVPPDPAPAIDIWNGKSGGKRNFRTIELIDPPLVNGDLLLLRVCLDDNAGVSNVICYAVVLEYQ